MSKEVGEMVRSRDVVQAEGSARTEGARRATGVRADGAAAGAGSLAPGQRWSASRKRDVVLRLLRGESLEALSREAGVEIYRLDAWRERAMAGLELGLKDRHGDPVAEVLDAAKRHIGELSMPRSSCSASGPGPRSSASLWRCGGRDDERDDLRGDGALFRHPAGVSGLGALALGALRAAGAGTPPGGRGAGAAGAAAEAIGRAAAGVRFGPISRGPLHGEGHRKVHARLRILDGIRVARTRVLRVMRAHGLLSPHRGRQGAAKTHDGRRHHPGAQRDVGDGRRAGIHARRRVGLDLRGSRTLERGVCGVARVQSREPLAALDPIAQGLERLYGSLDADVARGLALRMDHGTLYLQDHFRQANPVLGDPPQLRLCRGTGNERGGGAVESHAQEQASTAESFRTSRPSAPPWPTSWSGTTTWRLVSNADRGAQEYVLRQAA